MSQYDLIAESSKPSQQPAINPAKGSKRRKASIHNIHGNRFRVNLAGRANAYQDSIRMWDVKLIKYQSVHFSGDPANNHNGPE